MAMKVYKTGDKVAIEKDANPIFFIPVAFSSVRIVNDTVTVFSILDATVSEFDTVANIQNSGGTPIGNLTDVVKYLNGFIFSGSTTTQTESTPSGGEINDGVNVGLGDGVFKQKTGLDLEFKTLIGGTNVNLTNNPNDLTIDVPSVGEDNTGSNVGTGDGVFKQKVLEDLEFKTLIGGTNVTITNNANDLTIDASGGGGSYFKDSVVITSNSNNFNSGSPTDIPLMTYTITQDGDYILYAIVNTNPDADEGFNLYYAINGTTVNDSVVCNEFKKNKDVSIQGTWDVDGLLIGDIITIQADTMNDNQDLRTRRIIIQSWT